MQSFQRTITAASMMFVVLGGPAVAQTMRAADVFALSSPSFNDGGYLALKNAGNNRANPNCLGDNVSPPLQWSNVPTGTKSFALIMVDLQGRGGQGVDHWVAYGIPASVTGFAEGEISTPSEKFVGGKGITGVGTYLGPCAPPGSLRHYAFTLIATDLDPKELPPGLTRDELLSKLVGHGKDATALIGLFSHP
jgi:Raf kinase inhibitor-like YbhB/YbcL family protein